MRFPPANMQLRRAQLVLMIAVLVPTVMMSAIGIILLAMERSVTTAVLGILVLALCGSGITGFILVTIFVGKGASLVLLQNDFVSSVSHELRTPVTSLRLLIASLSTGRLEATEQAQVLSLLGRETDRLEVLVDRVLELSRLQSSHVYLRERIEVAALVEEAVAAFDALTLTRPTRITISVEPGLTVVGDRPTLVSAIANLLTNAWKYTGEDKRIAVAAYTAGRYVELTVTDNGVGIEKGDQGAIFEQFNRGRAASQGGIPGVGLGLAFVRTIIRGHKGKIDFTSRPGETTFRIRLKRRRKPAPRPTNIGHAELSEARS